MLDRAAQKATCDACGHIDEDVAFSADSPSRIWKCFQISCPNCKARRTVVLPSSGVRVSRNAQLSGKDKPVVWWHPELGPRFPGRNDVPMPEMYKQQGFERREFGTVGEHAKFCKDNGLVNAKAEDHNSSRHGLGILSNSPDRGY